MLDLKIQEQVDSILYILFMENPADVLWMNS